MVKKTNHWRDFHIRYDPSDPAMSDIESLRQYMTVHHLKVLLLESLCLGAGILVKKLDQTHGISFNHLTSFSHKRVYSIDRLDDSVTEYKIEPLQLKPSHVAEKNDLNSLISKLTIASKKELMIDPTPSEPFITKLVAKHALTADVKYSDATLSLLNEWGSD